MRTPPQAVDTLAALKADSGRPGETRALAGYYAAGDGGGGTFWWDGTSTATADDGLVVQPTSVTGAGRWRRVVPAGEADAAWWGAIADDATDRTARMQAAVDSGAGHIRIRDNGHIMVWSTVSLPSNTFLDCDLTARVRSTQQPAPDLNLSKPLLRNKTYFGTQVFTINLSRPSTQDTSWALSVNGDIDSSVPNGVTGAQLKTRIEALPNVPAGSVASVTGGAGGPWTVTFDVAKIGAVSMEARATEGTVTLTRGGTGDHDIRVRGGVWDCGNAREVSADVPGQAAGYGGNGIGGMFSWAAVDGLTVEDCQMGNTGMSITMTVSCTRIVYRNIHIYKGDLDGIHFAGPWWDLLVEGVTGTTFDDGIILMPQDWRINSPYKGHGRKTLVRDCRMGSCGAHLVRISTSGGANLYDCTIRNCHADSVGLAAITHHVDADAFDSGVNPYTTGLARNLLIENVTVGRWVNVWMIVGQPFDNLTIRDCPTSGAFATDGAFVHVQPTVVDAVTGGADEIGGRGLLIENCRSAADISFGPVLRNLGGNLKGVTLDKISYLTPNDTSSPGPVVQATAGLIDNLTLTNVVADLWRARLVEVTGSAHVRDLTVRDARVTQGTATNPVVVFNDSTGGIDRIWLDRIHASGGVHFVYQASAVPVEVWMRDCVVEGYANVFFMPAAVVAVLHWAHNRFHNCNYLIARTTANGGDTTVLAEHNRTTGTFTQVYIFNAGGSDTYRYVGTDLPQDLTMISARQKWDVARSLVDATGPAMFDGAAWQKWGHA